MSDIVRTTGRPMTRALQDAIDGLPDRELTIRALDEHAATTDGVLARVYAALALELRLAALREQDTLHRLEVERSDSLPSGPPLPQVTGREATFDPDTGEAGR